MPKMGTGVLPPYALRDAAPGSTNGIKMAAPRVVLDTNILIVVARSRIGASFALVRSIPTAKFQPCFCVGLYAEQRRA